MAKPTVRREKGVFLFFLLGIVKKIRCDPLGSIRYHHEGHEDKIYEGHEDTTKTLCLSFFSRACATEKYCKKDATGRVLL